MPKIDDKNEIFQRLLIMQVVEGKMYLGVELPSERNLAEQYGISRVTVRCVLTSMLDLGILKRNLRGRLTVAMTGEEVINILCNGRCIRIGIVFKQYRIDSNFYLTFFQALVKALPLHCRPVVFYHDFLQPEAYLENGIDLLLVDCAFDDQQLGVLPRNMPLVLLNREHKNLSYIACDNFCGGYEMAKMGFELGHREVACLCGTNIYSDGEFSQRLEGIRQACRDYGMEWDDMVKLSINRGSGFFQVAQHLLHNFPRLTLLLILTDAWSIEMIETFRMLKIKIPERISLIGYDDLHTGAYLTPPLTSVHQPFELMGERLAEVISNWQPGRKLVLAEKLRPSLISRGSIGKIG